MQHNLTSSLLHRENKLNTQLSSLALSAGVTDGATMPVLLHSSLEHFTSPLPSRLLSLHRSTERTIALDPVAVLHCLQVPMLLPLSKFR